MHTYPKSSREVDFKGDFLMTSRDEKIVRTDNKVKICEGDVYREASTIILALQTEPCVHESACRKKGVVDGVSPGQDQEPIM